MNDLPARLRGFGPIGIAAVILIFAANLIVAPLGAILVLIWARIARVSWRELGFRRPRNWAGTILLGVVAGVLLKLLLKAAVMPLLGAPPINAAYHFISGNTPALIRLIIVSIITGGLGEEVLYRGFLFERLDRLFGKSRQAMIATVLLTTALFASIHIPEQGPYGAVQALFTGLTFGTVFAVTRSLWLPIVMHAAYDVVAVVLIYLGLEQSVARLFFG